MNIHVRALQRAQDSLPSGLLARERARERALKRLRKLREKAEAEVERLLTFLDAVDGYTATELEVTVDDEPCDDDELEGNFTGMDGRVVPTQFHDPAGDMEADGSDDEWSLGSLTSTYGGGDQSNWSGGSGGDLEDGGLGNEDREDDGIAEGELDTSDDEVSLGWTEQIAQGGNSWFTPTESERELQDHASIDATKERARRSKGKRKPRTMALESNVTGRKRLSNLSKRQYELVKPRQDRFDPAFKNPNPSSGWY